MADGTLKVGTITTSSGSGTINLGASGETITSSAVMGGGMGKVLQVVSATYGTQESTSSTSFVATSLTASITPASTSNKVLIMVSGTETASNNLSHCITTIYRDGTTNLGDSSYGISYAYSGAGSAHSGISMNYLDSPSTTSSTEYKMYFRGSAAHAQYVQNAGALSTIILMEIAG